MLPASPKSRKCFFFLKVAQRVFLPLVLVSTTIMVLEKLGNYLLEIACVEEDWVVEVFSILL